jgi:signal transduction histidine kinase
LNQTTLELKEAQRQLQEYAADLEQKVQQRTAKLTEAMGELESWSYSIAHDMRRPLRAMEGFSTILRVDYGSQLDATGQNYLMRISAAAERLDRFIQDLLNYGTMGREDLPMEPIDTEQLIHQILDSYPNLHPAKADIQIQQPLPAVRANRPALTQVISNLLGNAVKFVKPGTRPQVRVWAEEEKDWTCLWFEDNGIGIEKESQQRIFQMFHRLNRPESYEGTGMGLAIVNKAVRRMGGTGGVESEPGHGSRFWVRLPNRASCDQASAESGEPTRPSRAEPQHRS